MKKSVFPFFLLYNAYGGDTQSELPFFQLLGNIAFNFMIYDIYYYENSQWNGAKNCFLAYRVFVLEDLPAGQKFKMS